jgi:hypothetical protein
MQPLDECRPDEDIGEFLGTYLFEDIGVVECIVWKYRKSRGWR